MIVLFLLFFIAMSIAIIGTFNRIGDDELPLIEKYLKERGYNSVLSIEKLIVSDYTNCPYSNKLIRPAVRIGVTFRSTHDLIIRKVEAINNKSEIESLWVLVKKNTFSGKTEFDSQLR